MEFEPQIIKKDGANEFVVLVYKDYLKIKQTLEDYKDLVDLRSAKVDTIKEPGIPFNAAKESLLSKKNKN